MNWTNPQVLLMVASIAGSGLLAFGVAKAQLAQLRADMDKVKAETVSRRELELALAPLNAQLAMINSTQARIEGRLDTYFNKH